MTTLVVSATAAEAAHVPTGLEVVVTGIGKTAAAAVTTEALLRRVVDDVMVVNIGTVGALRAGLRGLVLPSTVINHDINGDAIRALGYDPLDVLAVDGGDGTVLASGDVFVTDVALRARLASIAHVVDMEGYGVVCTCPAARGGGAPRQARVRRRRRFGERLAVACGQRRRERSAVGSPNTPTDDDRPRRQRPSSAQSVRSDPSSAKARYGWYRTSQGWPSGSAK